jgi:ubiquinone/menaquinone biosynthesis C-methylase UbiE
MNESKLIQNNIEVHDKIYKQYDKRHAEIFNDVEQVRLQLALNKAIELISTGTESKTVLDFGCGTGNLTNHLLKFGLKVTAADVSEFFLNLISLNHQNDPLLETAKLNGTDLSNFSDNKFDMVATYSVLHHIPDYLQAIVELIRVTKPGGIIYIDHEVNDSYWEKSEIYSRFLERVVTKTDWSKYFKLSNYYTRIVQLFNPRYQFEGDIHVFPDDHIEWDVITNLLKQYNCEVLHKENYLHFNSKYDLGIYNEFKDKCTDMSVLVAKKKQ